MKVVIEDKAILHEVSLLEQEIYSVTLSDSHFIAIVDDDIMEVIIADGVCC